MTPSSSGSERVLGFLSAPPATHQLPKAKVPATYRTWRINVFLGIFLGYAGFYLIRNNVSLVSSILKDNDIMNATGIGLVTNAVLLSYGLSKFLMAMISDRANARYFMPLGLALSAVMNLLIAFVPTLSASVGMFALMMFINGWFQGMGWPPSGRVLVHWFSTTERGWMTSIWNCAHNVGGAGVGIISAWALSTFAVNDTDWKPAFWTPAIVALIVSLIAFLLIRDRPEAIGLPPIEEYRNDPAKVELAKDEATASWKDILVNHVLKNRVIVLLAVTNVFVYTLRYGVLNWIPIYLTDQIHGTDVKDGILGFAIYEGAGIVGTLLCGLISDKVFKGWRSGAGMLFLGGVGGALLMYWLLPATAPIWVFYLLIACIGGLIYGPVMLIGLQAIDLSPRSVAGTAAGFTGLFGYLIGATLASTGVGLLIDHFGWDVTYGFLVLIAVVSVALMAAVGRDERRLMNERKITASTNTSA